MQELTSYVLSELHVLGIKATSIALIMTVVDIIMVIGICCCIISRYIKTIAVLLLTSTVAQAQR